jgi:3-deoxy-7-phosphoheptulonate synthase
MTCESTLLPPALQQPDWGDDPRLSAVCERLGSAAPPVDVAACEELRQGLESARAGRAFVVFAGDCAEVFSESSRRHVVAKAELLHHLGDVISADTGLPTVRIGRFGGQFAKPRSQPYEELTDGRLVPSYRGDAVNGASPDQRQPDPTRMLLAHHHSVEAVKAVRDWDRSRAVQIRRGGGVLPPTTFLGHEALLLDYERALLRGAEGRHASSGHYLWIGDRTRDPSHAHVAFAAAIDNPVGVKLGPSATPREVVELAELLDPDYRPGRLSFIVRMGATAIGELLPPLLTALGPRAHHVLWILDPMHGNGRTNQRGQKVRLLSDLRCEIDTFFAILARHGLWPAGIHLETTPDDVTECVSGPTDLNQWLSNYRSACDPRLNPAQALAVARHVAMLLQRRRVAA